MDTIFQLANKQPKREAKQGRSTDGRIQRAGLGSDGTACRAITGEIEQRVRDAGYTQTSSNTEIVQFLETQRSFCPSFVTPEAWEIVLTIWIDCARAVGHWYWSDLGRGISGKSTADEVVFNDEVVEDTSQVSIDSDRATQQLITLLRDQIGVADENAIRFADAPDGYSTMIEGVRLPSGWSWSFSSNKRIIRLRHDESGTYTKSILPAQLVTPRKAPTRR